MDVAGVPTIWITSLTGALLFYAGGRTLVRKAEAAPQPHADPMRDGAEDRSGAPRSDALRSDALRSDALRSDALEAALEAERARSAALEAERARCAALLRQLEDERGARAWASGEAGREHGRLAEEMERLRAELADRIDQIALLRAQLAADGDAHRARAASAEAKASTLATELEKARGQFAVATAATRRLSGEAALLRTRVAEQARDASASEAARAELVAATAREAATSAARATEAARLRDENARLERALAALEHDRASPPSLAELQRKNVEVSMKLRALEQREGELASKEAENAELRRKVEALSALASEAADLRRRVRDLEARGFARTTRATTPSRDAIVPSERSTELETSLVTGLRELCARDEGCRAAVLSDMRGLLIAACGEPSCRDELAAAAALTTYTADRLRELLPLGEAAELEMVDDNRLVLRTRWLRSGEECFLLSTLGVAPDDDDAAEAIRRKLAELIGTA